jgi:hypothetical protein
LPTFEVGGLAITAEPPADRHAARLPLWSRHRRARLLSSWLPDGRLAVLRLFSRAISEHEALMRRAPSATCAAQALPQRQGPFRHGAGACHRRRARHAASIEQRAHPCPCCGARMVIIETFAAGCVPRHRPTVRHPARPIAYCDVSVLTTRARWQMCRIRTEERTNSKRKLPLPHLKRHPLHLRQLQSSCRPIAPCLVAISCQLERCWCQPADGVRRRATASAPAQARLLLRKVPSLGW